MQPKLVGNLGRQCDVHWRGIVDRLLEGEGPDAQQEQRLHGFEASTLRCVDIPSKASYRVDEIRVQGCMLR